MSKKIDLQIIIGSKSDESKIKSSLELLDEFDLEWDFKVASAHRSPTYVEEIVDNAIRQGVKVFITGAGMANHLSGTVAAKTILPVIGIPFSSGALNGMDSLLSTVQMPPGIPVATVGVDSAKNAVLLAIQIIALENKELQKKILEYRHKEAEKIKNAF